MGYVLSLSSQHLPRASDHINKHPVAHYPRARPAANTPPPHHRTHARVVDARILPPPAVLLPPHERPCSRCTSPPYPVWKVAIIDGAISLWSTRLWMVYVVLQLAHLRENRALLVKRQRALDKLSSRKKLQP